MPKIRNLTIYHIDDDAQLLSGGDIKVLCISGQYVPFLSCVSILERFPTVTVDDGAIRFVCNGADVMRPGIMCNDAFDCNSIVCVIESRKKYLAVGISKMDSESLAVATRGAALKNIHYISDKYWESCKLIP